MKKTETGFGDHPNQNHLQQNRSIKQFDLQATKNEVEGVSTWIEV